MDTLGARNTVTCPYNEAHVIRRERIQFHLIKCKAANRGVETVACLFNSTHLMQGNSFGTHTNECCDKKKLESFCYHHSNEQTSQKLFPIPKIDVGSSENWDDIDVPTYDPGKKFEEEKLLQLKQVAPPSERKKFRAEERRKFQSADVKKEKIHENVNVPRLPAAKSTVQVTTEEELTAKFQELSVKNQNTRQQQKELKMIKRKRRNSKKLNLNMVPQSKEEKLEVINKNTPNTAAQSTATQNNTHFELSNPNLNQMTDNDGFQVVSHKNRKKK